MSEKRILVGLSGGVDSAICVKRLIADGYTPTGIYLDMKSTDTLKPVLIENPEYENEDIKSAFQCAGTYGIKLYKYGCASAFDRIVKENFAREYALGRTPNPCVICNRLVKFAELCRCADILGCEKIATGHYAKVGTGKNGRYYIEKGKDEKKDQSYMLWNLSQSQLSMCVFPLGDTVKQESFELAKKDGLIAAKRTESLDICFIEDGDDYKSFIRRRLGDFSCGDFISPDGKVCGQHKGIINYTVGQRKGLGIALGEPVFVKSINGIENKIYLARSGEEYTDRITVSGLNFVAMEETGAFSGKLYVKIRYAATPVIADVTIKDDICTVIFPEPVRAATPGQSAVFYDDDKVMFGGFID